MDTGFRVRSIRKSPPVSDDYETWIFEKPVGAAKKYRIHVRSGKTLDTFLLKSDIVNNLSLHIKRIRSTRRSLFESKKFERIKSCPVCDSPVKNSKFLLNVYGGLYHRCLNCSHSFLINRPTKSALDKFYSRNIRYAATYADKKTIRTRIRQVAMPKAEWMIERFKATYKRKPRIIVDVGAGAGHFVYACKQLGLRSHGIELNKSCIDFCRKNFNIDLQAVDFMKKWRDFSDADIVTFWGVIEHVADPMGLLKTARKVLSGKGGLLIAEVPRWDSITTAVQRAFPQRVVRHLDPLGHPNIFTDSSLFTAFEISGFRPVATWYFGMDAYELVMHLSHLSRQSPIMEVLRKYAGFMQSVIDQNRLSDTIVFVGKPDEKR